MSVVRNAPRRLPLAAVISAAGLLAALLAWTGPAVAADDAPKVPSKIYAVVFGVVFDPKGDVNQLRMVRVLDIREGNKDATDVVVPERFVDAVRKMLASPRYKPKPADVKPEEIAEKLKKYSRKRWDSQPAAPSAGCIFKNAATIPAGKLIDELGLKDTSVGGARISPVHGNFIVNQGGAKAADVLALMDKVRARARAERGIDLEAEVIVLGVDE